MAKDLKKVPKKDKKKDPKKDSKNDNKKLDEKNSLDKKFSFSKKIISKLFVCKCNCSYEVNILSSNYLINQYESGINIPICHNCHTTKTKKDTLLDESGNVEKFHSKFTYNIDGDKK